MMAAIPLSPMAIWTVDSPGLTLAASAIITVHALPEEIQTLPRRHIPARLAEDR